MPRVSVILPVYNTEVYLADCLQSICDQSFRDIEILCINDGSVDGSLQVLQDYAALDHRIRIIDLGSNRGVSAARNTGIEQSAGEYILFVDSDDRIGPNYILKMLEQIESDSADAVANVNIVREYMNGASEDYFGRRFAFLQGGKAVRTSAGQLLELNSYGIVPCYLYLYRRALLCASGIRFRDYRAHEDLFFQHEILNRCSRLFIFSGDVYHYRVNSEGLSNTIRDPFLLLLSVYRDLFALYVREGWIQNRIAFIQFRNLAELQKPQQYPLLQEFIEDCYPVLSPIIECFSECDRFILEAYSEGLDYDDFSEKYSTNIVKLFHFRKFRSNIVSGMNRR